MKTAFACVALLLSTAAASAYDLVLINTSEYVIEHLYVSPAKAGNWGNDQIAGHTVKKDEKFTLRNIPGGVYDLKVIDEDEEECVVHNIELDADKTWTFTDKYLDECVKK